MLNLVLQKVKKNEVPSYHSTWAITIMLRVGLWGPPMGDRGKRVHPAQAYSTLVVLVFMLGWVEFNWELWQQSQEMGLVKSAIPYMYRLLNAKWSIKDVSCESLFITFQIRISFWLISLCRFRAFKIVCKHFFLPLSSISW